MAEKVYLLNYADGIPSDWSANKFRQVFSFRKGLSITKDNLVDEGVPVISYGQIHSKLNTGTGLNDSLIRFVPETYMKTSADCLARYGDLVFADTSEDYDGIGNCALIDTEAPIFAGYHTIIARPIGTHVDSKYFAYLFQTDLWRAQIRSGVMGIKVFSVTQKDLRETMIFLPPLSEQHAIAAYLDRKCGQIDEIIADLQRQIECLQSYKKSLISEVVTKGLNPGVPMKDSGIEWIGQIPEHWEMLPFRVCVQSVTSGLSAVTNDDTEESGKYVLRTSAVSSGIFIDTEVKAVTSYAENRLVCPVEADTVIMSRMNTSAMVGASAYIERNYEGYFLPDKLWKVKFNDRLLAKYAWYLMNSEPVRQWFGCVATGSSASMQNN